MFITENGLLDLDSIIINNPSYQKIMEDGIVTDEEIQEQAKKIDSMLKDMKSKYTPEQFEEVQKLIAEVSVLFVINK
ncbi:MAG: hypothetical protein Q4F52_06695 [Bacteroidaceae bacterium]|nr:hypothetical protein [Bacteroidaceae bacterium]